MLARPDLLEANSPNGLEVFQLTTETSVSSCHIYMEAQIFTPDSRYFLLQRSGHPHGCDRHDPEHRFLRCDTATGEIAPVTTELGATAPSISPDGKFIFYFVDETDVGTGRLTLRRRNIDGANPVTITVIDRPIPGTFFRPSRIDPLSTISSDGKRLAISCFLGDGNYTGAPWGLLVFDLTDGSVRLPLVGPSWCNIHPQYSRSLNAGQSHDILVQENHGNHCSANGDIDVLISGAGADIHVIRDDGQHFRNLPWGRKASEQCQGHQCWRGRSDWAITSTMASRGVQELIESQAIGHVDHNGLEGGGVRNNLSANLEAPHFFHFATDIQGDLLITDSREAERDALYLMELGTLGTQPFNSSHFLMRPQASWTKDAHIHPFLSPDGKTAFFNSDESGILQAYMLRNLG